MNYTHLTRNGKYQIAVLAKLGMDVEIVVCPGAGKRQSEGAVSVVFA
jgi:hypothetical protein